jgi:putative ABC transport system permease protein
MSKINQYSIHPPKWPLRVLRFFLKKEYLEEIEGDMEEIFRDNVDQLSYKDAKKIYIKEMFKLLRPILVRNLSNIRGINRLDMLQNYFRVSLRGLMRTPLNSFINLFGLSMAIGICIMGYGFAQWTYRTDQFHEHKDEVYLVTFSTDRDDKEQYGRTPRPLGEMLHEDFTHIKKVCRVEDRNLIIKHNGDVFQEKIRFTDPSFLEMLTFPLKWGSASSLSDLNGIILSESASERFFGDLNPVGQTLLLKFAKDRDKEFKVTGVAKEFPTSITIEFDFLINFENLRESDPGYDFHDWSALINATLIQVDDPKYIGTVAAGMNKYKQMQNKAVNEDWAISAFGFEPLATLHKRAGNIKDDISRNSGDNYKSVVFLAIIGVFMLILACLNYINIAIVSAARRLKEIGVRKSIGATRKVVMFQFLTENIVITFFALVIGLFLGGMGFIPWFERINNFDMGFRFIDPNLWIYLPAILLITGISSGAYPAFYISKFQVVGIFRGTVKFGKKNPLTKIFLCIQLMLACIFITTAVMFTENTFYIANRSWGYHQSEALYSIVPDHLAYEELSAVMSRDPNVLSVSGSAHHLGKSHKTTVIHTPGHEYEADEIDVAPNYFETMGIGLEEGRLFNDHEGSDKQSVVVNETMVKSMGWSEPTKEVFKIDSIQYQVVGVVKDFHSYSFYSLVRPTMFRVADKNDYRYLSVKVREGSQVSAFESLQSNWKQLFPEVPFAGGHQEDVWGRYFSAINTHGNVWQVIATIAVVLTTLGLYGLMTLNVAGRVREFSIRKVLGANMKNITASITRQYVLLVTIALATGAPISYILVKVVFDFAYKYHMPVDFSGVTMAVILLVVVLVITVLSQVRKVVKANPVDGLKIE